MKIQNAKFDVEATLGKRYWMTDIIPVNAYIDNKRTEEIIGYRYTIILPDRGLNKISVKIDGKRRMDIPENFVPVEFDELELYVYCLEGKSKIGARARDIHPVMEVVVE